MTPDDIVESMLTCKENDVTAIASLNQALMEHSDIKVDHLTLSRKIRNVLALINDHCIGEGILIGEDENGQVDCFYTHGIADYSYVSNLGHHRGDSYEALMVDIVGQIKDGDIKVLDLFLRRNTCAKGVVEAELEYVVPAGDGRTVLLKAVDKFDLSTIMEINEDDSDDILDWYDAICGIKPSYTVTSGEGDNIAIIQSRLDDEVKQILFKDISEVIDLIFQDTVLYLHIK